MSGWNSLYLRADGTDFAPRFWPAAVQGGSYHRADIFSGGCWQREEESSHGAFGHTACKHVTAQSKIPVNTSFAGPSAEVDANSLGASGRASPPKTETMKPIPAYIWMDLSKDRRIIYSRSHHLASSMSPASPFAVCVLLHVRHPIQECHFVHSVDRIAGWAVHIT
jgi:hypothetical protein